MAGMSASVMSRKLTACNSFRWMLAAGVTLQILPGVLGILLPRTTGI
jgi:hypothetical protein